MHFNHLVFTLVLLLPTIHGQHKQVGRIVLRPIVSTYFTCRREEQTVVEKMRSFARSPAFIIV